MNIYGMCIWVQVSTVCMWKSDNKLCWVASFSTFSWVPCYHSRAYVCLASFCLLNYHPLEQSWFLFESLTDKHWELRQEQFHHKSSKNSTLRMSVLPPISALIYCSPASILLTPLSPGHWAPAGMSVSSFSKPSSWYPALLLFRVFFFFRIQLLCPSVRFS